MNNPEVAKSVLAAGVRTNFHDIGSGPPVLLIHGDDDRNVPFTESVTLAYELRKRGVPVEELIFPDEVHDFLLWRNWVSAYHAADEFLGRRLKVGATAATASGSR